MKASCNLST